MNDSFEPGHKGETRDIYQKWEDFKGKLHEQRIRNMVEPDRFMLSDAFFAIRNLPTTLKLFNKSGQTGAEMAEHAKKRTQGWNSATPQPHLPSDKKADAGTIKGTSDLFYQHNPQRLRVTDQAERPLPTFDFNQNSKVEKLLLFLHNPGRSIKNLLFGNVIQAERDAEMRRILKNMEESGNVGKEMHDAAIERAHLEQGKGKNTPDSPTEP